MRVARRTYLMIGLLVAALPLLLGAMVLMIAALVIGLAKGPSTHQLRKDPEPFLKSDHLQRLAGMTGRLRSHLETIAGLRAKFAQLASPGG